MLALYRDALQLRRTTFTQPPLEGMTWDESFARDRSRLGGDIPRGRCYCAAERSGGTAGQDVLVEPREWAARSDP